MPAMNLPAIIIGIFAAPACNAQPIVEMTAPIKTAILRPYLSGSQATERAPRIAPPVNDETIPPVSEAVGVPI